MMYIIELECSDQDVHGSVATHILAPIYISLSLIFQPEMLQATIVIWEAIERIERLGLKVVVLTADGGSPNRKFFTCMPSHQIFVIEPAIYMLLKRVSLRMCHI